MKIVKLLVMLMSFCFAYSVFAKDFGKPGHVYNIEEQPFLEMIKERLEKVDIKEEQKKMQEKAKQRVEKPKPAPGIVTATENQSWYWDPTHVVAKDIVLPCGKILHKAGTKVNPLDHMDFDRKLFFINSDDDEQVSFLLEQISQDSHLEERIILTSGSPMKLKEELLDSGFKHNVYFDQFGEVTGRLGIKAVPAIALQEGQQIRINEISME